MEQEVPFERLVEAVEEGTDPDNRRPLFRVRFYNEMDAPTQSQLSSTSTTADLTIFINRVFADDNSTAASVRIVYNQILFSPRRIQYIFSQMESILLSAVGAPETPVGQIALSDYQSPDSPLPDPTADLHWSLWRGAIPDIFAANAEKHPERTCIVETPDNPMDPKVVYTYQHIHHASNLVAHYLIENGIQREDVVMIYAYRGVDLVVAIMGVLKAGATFSVIGKLFWGWLDG